MRERDSVLRELFYPESVVVFGVSESPTNMGRQIVENLDQFDFKGPVYLVGKDGGTINGRKIYQTVEEIKEVPGLAVFLIPARFIPDALEACGKKGIRFAVIESGGFTEYGGEGNALARSVAKIAEKWNIRFVGPNCLSIVNIENGLVLPFLPLKPDAVRKGHVSLVAQSGGILIDSILFFSIENIGFSKMISIGNKLNLNETDYVEYLIADPQTRIIALYLESISDGRRLMDLARSTDKPIVVLKANTTDSSKEIASFHTAALAGDDTIVDAAFRQAGIMRIKSLQDMMDTIKILSIPPIKGPNLGIICRSGGRAVMTTDFACHYGFKLADYSDSFYDFVRERVRAGVIRMTNPIDLGDVFDVDEYIDIVDMAVQQPSVDGLVVHHNYRTNIDTEPTRRFIEAVRRLSFAYEKPIIFSVLSGKEDWFSMREIVDFPIFMGAEQALKALQQTYSHYKRKFCPQERIIYDRKAVKPLFSEERMSSDQEVFALLQSYDIPVADFAVVTTAEEGIKEANAMSYPVALKIVSPFILHKTEGKGVRLNIRSDDELRKNIKEMQEKGDMFLVQKMMATGREIIVGGKHDAEFGPVLLFGLGGIFVEVLKDVSFRIAPVSYQEANRMINEIKGARLLDEFRGQAAGDKEALATILVNVSRLLAEHPEIENLDINPLIVGDIGYGCVAVDAKMSVRDVSEQ